MGVFGILYFVPDVNISAGDRLDNADPLSVQWQFTNDGAWSLFNLDVVCLLNSVVLDGGTRLLNNSARDVGQDLLRVKQLRPGETQTVSCRNAFWSDDMAKVGEIDMTVHVDYRPHFWPIGTSAERRFVAKVGAGGVRVWTPRAVEDKTLEEFKRQRATGGTSAAPN